MAEPAPEQGDDHRARHISQLIDVVGSIVHRLIPWGGLVLVSYFWTSAITTLAGKHTIADIGIRMLADVKISEAVAYILGLGGIGYGIGQRKIRRDTIEREHRRVQELERRLDPNRTSSMLTLRGTTRPEDKP